MHKPLLLKLTTLVLVVTLLSMGVTTFFITMFATEAFQAKLQADLTSDAKLVSFWILDTGIIDIREKVEKLGRDTGRRFTLINMDGNVIADSHHDFERMENHRLRPEFSQALAGNLGTDQRISETTGEELIYVALPLSNQGAIRVAASSIAIADALEELYRGALLLTLLISLLALGVVFLINRNITDPLNDLLIVTKRLQNGEFGRRVLVRSHDEIGQLGRAFNELSMTLEKMFDTIHDRESKLNAVLTSMEDGVLAVNTYRRVILANRAVADLIGEDEEALIGKDQAEVIRSFELSEIITDTMNREKSINAEIKLYPGSERTIAVSSSPLEGDEGMTIGVVSVLRDITELRRLEQMQNEFVANVSHELRTPLTSIKGFVETILNGKTYDSALVERFLRIVSGETDRMITLINDLLDLSRIESGKQPINMGSVNILQIFTDTITMLQTKADQKEIKIDNCLRKIMVLGDAKLLRQVAINIVDNAIKYTKPGGRVWIEAKESTNKVKISICDTGVGIPSDQTNRIFERFYRVDKGRSRSMGGTGLGLSIVKHIIDKHKGKISAESQIGKGTTVKITLRLAK